VNKNAFFIVLIVGLLANGVPYGYAVALIVGTMLYYFARARGMLALQSNEN